MIKILITGLLLFVIMSGTAIVVSRHQPPMSQNANAWMSPHLVQNQTSLSFLDASNPRVVTYGESESGGIEDNRFVVILGLVAIICFALSFWKHHQILEGRRKDDDAVKTEEQEHSHFGTHSSYKDPPK